jgi:hypothetical protein
MSSFHFEIWSFFQIVFFSWNLWSNSFDEMADSKPFPVPPSAPPSCTPAPRTSFNSVRKLQESKELSVLSLKDKISAIRSWLTSKSLQALIVGSEDAHQVFHRFDQT